MYKNMYDTFDNKSVPYSYPFSFQKGDKTEYMVGEEPTYEMDYEDTLVIPFQISCKYLEDYINIILYNYRHEEIYYTSQKPDENGKVYLNIDEDLSKKLLKKGYYYIKLQAEGLIGTMITIKTLINAEDCTLYVR